MNMYSPSEQLVVALKKKDFVEAERLLNEENADINSQNIRGETPAFFFAEAPSLNVLNWLIEHGADLDIPNNMGDTPLLKAVTRNDALAVDALLTAGADVDKKNARKICPLMQAVLNEKDHGVLERLLEAMPDVDAQSETQTTPVMAAAARGKASYVEKLLDAGADPEVVDYLGMGLFHAAVSSREAAVVRVVVEKCPLLDPNYNARSGSSPMSMSIGSTEITSMLLDAGGDPNAKGGNRMDDGVTLLMAVLGADSQSDLPMKADKSQAAQGGGLAVMMGGGGGGNDELVEKMLTKGARVDVRNDDGQNAGVFAVFSGATRHLAKLVAHGLDPTRPLDASSLLPYDILANPKIDFDAPETLDLITQWRQIGFPFTRPEWDESIDGPFTATRQESYQPMHSVLQRFLQVGFIQGFEHALNLGADLNEKSINDNTVAHLVVGFDGMSPEVKKALALAARAKNIDPTTKEQQLAEIRQQAKDTLDNFRQLLNKYNIDWSAQTKGGNTPLHIAAGKDDREWAKYLLLDRQVDPSVRNNEGLTAAGAALRAGNVEMFHAICEIAKQRGYDVSSSVLLDTVQASSDDFRERQPWLRAVGALYDKWTDAQKNFKNADGQTPLCFASGTDQHDVVRALLKIGADHSIGDAQGNTPLMQATFIENGEIIRLLRAGGANPQQANKQGANAYDVADYVKSPYVHNSLNADDLGELIQDLLPVVLTEREQKQKEIFEVRLENEVRSWKGEALLPVPELPKEEAPVVADPNTATTPADPNAQPDPAADPNAAPVASSSARKGP